MIFQIKVFLDIQRFKVWFKALMSVKSEGPYIEQSLCMFLQYSRKRK